MNSVKLEEHNEHSFKAAGFDKAFLAIGSCESHGAHLPFGCDTYVGYDLALEVARRRDKTVVGPPLWYGMSQHYSHKPICLSLSNDTLTRVVRDLLHSLVRWGLRKILVINGHDGNISPIPLPGGINSMISGIGVFYPDGTPTQRIGIVPDLEVLPTVEGIRAGRDEVLEAAVSHALGREFRLRR